VTSEPNSDQETDPLDLPQPQAAEPLREDTLAENALAAAIPSLGDDLPRGGDGALRSGDGALRSGDGAPRSGEDHALRPLVIPRGLVMLAALWIFLSWVLLFGVKPPVQPQAASYGPSLRILFTSIGVGIAIGWPLLRLSARPSRAPILQALIDGLAIVVLTQVVVWPLRLVTNWTLSRTMGIFLAISAMIALTAALLGAVQGARTQGRRTAGMAVAAVAALLPILASIASEWVAPSLDPSFAPAPLEAAPRGWIDALVPLSAPALLSRLAAPTPLDPPPGEQALLHGALLAAAVAWAMLLATRGWRGRPAPRDPLDS